MKKFALTLGGGGARGAVHIGIWMEMERLGLRPQLLTGTSIGGIMAALIAAGLSSEELITFYKKFDLPKLYALPLGKPAITDNKKLERLLQDTIGRPTFAELKIPLAVVATDMIARTEVILDEGDVISAVLATSAFPVVLPPVERDGLILVDGGILNNVPFDVARARGAPRVIAVALSNSAPYGTPSDNVVGKGLLNRMLSAAENTPIWQVVTTVSDILTSRSIDTRHGISRADILLRPYVGTVGLFDFDNMEQGIEAGRKAFRDAEQEIKAILQETSRLDE
ncbi:MAG: patatin-like phospholipase family protein [Chloroflexi bacterium]|nr:patatin-like phospholipase family protein [Chloroflexota bacterium]MBP8059426.1 patatin-like phospholipase family protein [Chloroflexota bacterium]